MAKIGSITDKAKEQAKKKKPGSTIDSLLGGKKQGSGLLSGKKQSGGILSGNKSQGSGLLSGGAQPNDAYQAAIAKLMGGINNGITTGLNQIPKPNIYTPQPMGYTQPQGMKQPGGMPNYAEMLANRSLGGGQTQGIQLPGTQNLQGIVPAAQTGGSADYVRRVLGMSSNINQPQRPANRMQTVQAQGITAPSMKTTSNNYAGNTAQRDNFGQYGAGNIDLNHRQVVHNPDGSISTERSFSVNIDGQEVLLPTVIGGRIVSEDEAIQHYYDTGEFLGKFNTPQEADDYAQKLHERQEQYYGNQLGNVAPVAGAPAGNTAPMFNGPMPEEVREQQNAAENSSAMQDYINRYRGNVEETKKKEQKWSPVNISAQDKLRKKEAEGLGVPESSLPYMRKSKGMEIRADQWEKNKPNARDTRKFAEWWAEGVRLGKIQTNAKNTLILSTTKELEESITYLEEQLKEAEELLKNPEERPVQPIMPTAGLEFNVAQNMNSGIFEDFRAADEQWKEDEARWQYLYNGGLIDELTEQLETAREELEYRKEVNVMPEDLKYGRLDKLPENVQMYMGTGEFRNVEMDDADQVYIYLNWGIKGMSPDAIVDYDSEYSLADIMPKQAITEFNVKYNSGDKEGAMEVYERWEPLMEEMRDYNTQERAKEEAHGNLGWLKSLLTVPINAGLGVLEPARAMASLISGKDPDKGTPLHKWSVSTAATRQESIRMAGDWFAERFGEDARHWGEFAMSTSYSILDNLYLMGISKIGTSGWTPEQIQTGCSNFVLGMMFGEATGNVFTEQIQKGRSAREAAVMALGSGAIEVLTERVTIEKYMNIESIASLKNLLKSGIAEASEEFAAEILDAQLDIACSVIWQHKNEIEEMAEGYFQQYYDQYLKEGMSEEEARQAASRKASEETFNSFAGRLGEAALGGFVSTGPLFGFGAINSTINQNRVGGTILNQKNSRQNIEDLLTTVENNNPGKTENKLIRQIREDLNNNKELKKGKLGKLYQLAMQDAPAKIKNIFQESYTEVINDELERRGLNGQQIEELGPIVSKAALNEIKSLTPSERIALHRNETAANLMMELTQEMGQENKLLQEANEKAMKRSQGAMEIEQAAMKALTGKDNSLNNLVQKAIKDERRVSATEDEIEEAVTRGAQRTGSVTEALVNGEFRDITGFKTKLVNLEDDKGNTVIDKKTGKPIQVPKQFVTFSENEEDDVPLASIRTTNPEIAKIVATQRSLPGLIGDAYMTDVMNQVRRLGADVNENFVKEAFDIKLAAVIGTAMPNVTMDATAAQELNTIARMEQEEADRKAEKNSKNIVRNIVRGHGVTYLNGQELKQENLDKTLKGMGIDLLRRHSIEVAAAFIKESGFKVNLVEGEKSADLGHIDITSGIITIDISQEIGKENSGTFRDVLATLPHELIHLLRAESAQAYNELKDFVLKGMQEKGIDVKETLIKQYINYAQQGAVQNMDISMEDIIARACEQMFTSQEFKDSMQKQLSTGTFAKIKNFVKDILSKLNNVIANIRGTSDTLSWKLADMRDDIAKIWLTKQEQITSQAAQETAEQAIRPADQYTPEQTEAARDIVREAMEHPVTKFSINENNKGLQVQVIKNGLMAVHNLSERSFVSVLEMMGFPMPSIAVIGNQAWTGYGDISVFFGENAVRFAEGSVYNGDAMTPTLGNNRVRNTNEAMDVLHQQPARGSRGTSDMVQLFTDYKEAANIDEARKKAYQTTEERQQIKEQADALQNEIFDAAKRISTEKYGSDLNNRQLTQSIGMGILTAAEIMQREQDLTNEDRMQILQDNMDLMLEHAQGVDLTAEDFTTEQYEQMLEFIDVASQLSSGWRMMESKPDAVMDFKNDLKAVLMPDDTPNKIIQQALDAGIAKEKIYFYPHNNMKARQAAMMELPNVAEGVRFSLRNVSPVKSSDQSVWRPGHTEAWFRENGFPIYQDVPLDQQEINRDTSKKGHGTQIASTESTYRKLFERIKVQNREDWKNMRILDASSGLGLGTKAGREMGFNVTDIEPFPNQNYKPNYTDYMELEDKVESGEVEPFDFIISNAVLNVIPQDTRDNLVTTMGNLLKPGGSMFINVISKDYAGAMQSNPDLEISKAARKGSARTMEGDYTRSGNAAGRGHETFVWGSNSVQKVFSTPELIGYLKDALGDGYTVKRDNIGMTGVLVTKNAESNIDNTIKKAAKDAGLKVTDSGEIQNRSGTPIANILPGGTLVKHSLRSWEEEDIIKLKKTAIKAGFSEKKVNKWIKDIDSVGSIIAQDKGRLDFIPDRDQKFKKANGDVYKWTLDASTLCAKRLLYQGTFNEIQKHLADIPLLPEDLIDLANMMHEMGYQTPCGICYVESRRRHLGEFTKEFLDNYQGEYKPTYADLTSTEGLANLKRTHRQAYDDYMKAMNGKGVSSPKVVQLRTDYRGDVRDLNAQSIKALNEIGGLRINSFSDFETPHLMDMMQAVLDMSIAGLKSQAYTKVPNFAWAFGNTGIKINLSLMGDGTGVDENGNLIFSDTEGMKFDEAMKLRETYSKNVGTILVGMNDNHIIAAMGDPRIDYIIPFHKSGWSANELAKMKTLESYDDYTDSQNEKWITGVKKGGGYQTASIDKKIGNLDPYGENGYWNYNKDGEYNARKYLELCAKQKRLPKFSQFLVDHGDGTFSLPEGTDQRSENIRKGYWKTLIDFKMYDNNGKGAKQQKVQFDVNMEQAYRILDEYEAPEGGNNALPVAQPVVDKYVNYIKEKKAAEVKGPATSEYGNMTLGNEISEEENEEDYDSMPKPKARYADEENVRRSMRQLDEDYAKAVASKDMTTAQRMVDEAAENAGYVNEGYHGTLNGGFTIFDKKKAHIGGNSGAGFYFSSNQDDSEANYSDVEGADNHFKVMHLVEKIQQYIEDTGENEYAGIPIPEDATDAELEDIAKKMIQGNPQTYHVRLNPGRVYIRDYGKSTNLLENVYDDFDESDYNRDDFDSDEQYEDAVFEGREEHLYQAISDAVYEAIRDVDSNFEIVSNVDYESIISELAMHAMDYDELTWKDVSKVISEQYIDALVDDGEESADASAEITRAIVEAFGFDSIEDREVGTKFNQLKNMSARDTVHYIMFRPNQIKSTDPVTYDRNGDPIPLSQRFNQGNNDIRYSKRIAEQGVRQSRRTPDMDVNNWMESLQPWQLRTESERQLLQDYKDLRMKIQLQNKKISDYQDRLHRLEAKDQATLTDQEKRQMEGLKIRIQNAQNTRDELEEKLINITSDEGYAKIMMQQSKFVDDFLAGRTQDEVTEAVKRMQDTAGKMLQRANQSAEALKKIAEDAGVRDIRERNKANPQKMAAEIRKEYGSTINKQELADGLLAIQLKIQNGTDPEQVMADVETLAGKVLEGIKGEKSEYLGMLRGTTITLGPGQIKELHGSRRNMRDVRSILAGTGIKVKLATAQQIQDKKVTTLDSIWDELCDMVPLLNRDAYEKEQLFELMRVVQNEKKNSSGAQQYGEMLPEVMDDIMNRAMGQNLDKNMDPAVQKELEKIHKYVEGLTGKATELAEVIGTMQDMLGDVVKAGQQAATWTDAMKRDVANTIEYFDRTAKLAQDTARNEHLRQVIANLKSEAAQKLLKTNQEWRDLIERDRKARLQAEDNDAEKRKMDTVVKRIYNLLAGETDVKNIPEEYKGLARELIGMFNANDMTGRKLLRMDKKQRTRMNELLKAWNEQDGEFDISEFTGPDATDARRNVAWQIMDDLNVIREMMAEWNGQYKGKNRLDTLEQMGKTLTTMQEAVSEIYNIIKAGREMDIDGRRYQVEEMAIRFMADAERSGFKGEHGKAAAAIERAVKTGNITPEYFFKNLHNQALSKIWDEFKRSENRNGLLIKKTQEFMEGVADKYHYKTWDSKKTTRIETVNGPVNMTTEQMMALYATWKREHMPGPNKSEHLEKGGFYVEESKQKMFGRRTPQLKAHRMDAAHMAAVTNALTDEQKAYVDEIVAYLSTEIGKWGNEATMRMYGIKKYKEKYYYPMKSWGGVLNESSDSGMTNANNENRAAHQSHTKRRMNKANNAIEIGNFTDVVTNHIVNVINENTMAVAVENMNKMLNYKTEEGETWDTTTKRNMKTVFQQRYGQDAYNYLKMFMKDINGGVAQDPRGNVVDRLMSGFRKGAVAGSLSVAAQQPLSYIRAAMEINPIYLARALSPDTWKGSYKEMMAHSGVAVIKDMGRFDMGLGASAKEYIRPEAQTSVARKLAQKAGDWTTKLPEIMDRMTWTRMWSAVKAEQKHLHPEMDVKSNEFLDMVGERFNEVMRRTQVYDSVLVKSNNMRSKNIGAKLMTSFMAEPTVSLNVLMDAAQNIRQKGGMKKAAMAAATFLLSAVAQAAAKGIFAAGRNPDDDKTLKENFLYRMGSNLLSEANPLGLIPGYSDLIEILSKGELSNDAMTPIGKLAGIAQTIAKAKPENLGYRFWEDTVGQVWQLFGRVPAKNIMRDVRAMINWFDEAGAPVDFVGGTHYADRPTSSAVLKYQFIDSAMGNDLVGLINGLMGDAGYKTSNEAYYDRIYEAKTAGDADKAGEMTEYLLLGKGVKEKTLNSAIAKRARADESMSNMEKAEIVGEYGGRTSDIIKDAAEAGEISTAEALDKMDLKDPSDYVKDQLRDGSIDAAEARKLLKEQDPGKDDDSIWWTVDRIEYKKETGNDAGGGKYYRLWDAMDGNSANDIGNAIQTMQGHGVDAKSIKSNINSHYKELYLAADASGKVRIRDAMQKAYKQLGLTAGDADKVINKWK